MEVDLRLENPHFPWTKTEGNNLKCWLKGNLFHNDTILEGPGIISLFSSLPSSSGMYHDALKDLLLSFNGSFALVIETPDNLLCIVDRLRSIPLFYGKTDTRFIISDDANAIRDQINPPFNKNNGAEFLVTGYVTGRETLFDGIFQIQAGEYLSYSGKDNQTATFFYHRFWHGDYFSDAEEELLKRLDEVFIHVFQRLVASSKRKGLPMVVPLSGGLDSRIIVAMLKRLGADNVICFSYGRAKNHESEISKKVAEALGYQWYFVEYTNDKWHSCYPPEIGRAYERYAGNLVSLPHIQDFLALQELTKEGKIPEKSVFIPGHSGDFLAGTYIPLDYDKLQHYSFENYLHEILKSHYSLWELRKESDIWSYFNKKISDTTRHITINDRESYVNCVLCFVFNERVAKFIVNSVRVYEFFGYTWWMPLWDNELIDFFSKIPLKFRINEYLYLKYAGNVLFVDSLKKLQEIDCTTTILPNPNKSFKKKCEDIIENNEYLNRLWLWYYFSKKRLLAYNNETNAHYGMIDKEKFSTFYTGKEFPSSFLAMNYLENFIPTPLDLIRIKKRF
jgi:asparagine synthase (glutamine-hydrolysing)